MSKMTQTVKENKKNIDNEAVTNFMGGISYEINPIDTLKMVTASSIFGEPQYYRDGEFAEKTITDGTFKSHSLFKDYLVLEGFDNKKTSKIMEEVIDNALSYNFKETLEWALNLRLNFNMRLNPQVIMVRAASHPDRNKFTTEYPGLFDEINQKVMKRADEPTSQLTYYLYKNKTKKNIPGILKKSWKKKISGLSRYQLSKYKNKGLGLIDTIRICHASSKDIDELMKTGTLEVAENEQTWEKMRAENKSWREILNTIKVGHMARLRNLRGVFTEIDDVDFCKSYLEELKSGVKAGMQFPYRYKTAMNQIKLSKVNHKQLILDALEECIDIATENLPKLSGKTICLSDNSGSAHHGFTSEYGQTNIAEIGNLSSIITARNAEEGYIGLFGDKLEIIPVSKRNGVLTQAAEADKVGKTVGMSTENGIWLFFKQAIENKEHWDNIVIYSDMQAGHGGLYGTTEEKKIYAQKGYAVNGSYINVPKLIATYRKINPKVNVYCVQTAGYNNVLIPEMGYRTGILYGWTGKELNFIDTMNKFWDEKDNKQ